MRWFLFIAAFILFLLHNHADYLYQASLWEWWTWIDLTGRAPHWPWYADWIPHDAWHIVQSIRNHAGLIAAAAFMYAITQWMHANFKLAHKAWYEAYQQARFSTGRYPTNPKDHRPGYLIVKLYLMIPLPVWVVHTIALLMLYGITRAIAFTLPLELFN